MLGSRVVGQNEEAILDANGRSAWRFVPLHPFDEVVRLVRRFRQLGDGLRNCREMRQNWR